MSSAFISYQWKNKEIAHYIARELKVSEIDVWIDDDRIRVGDIIDRSFSEGVQKCDHVITLLSPSAVRSPWVQKETEIALAREAAEGRPILVPVLVEDCLLPDHLTTRKYIDATGERGRSSLMLQVLQTISDEELFVRPLLMEDGTDPFRGRITTGRTRWKLSNAPKNTLIIAQRPIRDVELLAVVQTSETSQLGERLIGTISATLAELPTDLIGKFSQYGDLLLSMFIQVADAATKERTVENGRQLGDIGARMSMALRIGDDIHMAAVGQCFFLCAFDTDAKERMIYTCYSHSMGVATTSVLARSTNPEAALSFPIGRFATDQEIVKADFSVLPRRGRFRGHGDYVLLCNEPLGRGLTDEDVILGCDRAVADKQKLMEWLLSTRHNPRAECLLAAWQC